MGQLDTSKLAHVLWQPKPPHASSSCRSAARSRRPAAACPSNELLPQCGLGGGGAGPGRPGGEGLGRGEDWTTTPGFGGGNRLGLGGGVDGLELGGGGLEFGGGNGLGLSGCGNGLGLGGGGIGPG